MTGEILTPTPPSKFRKSWTIFRTILCLVLKVRKVYITNESKHSNMKAVLNPSASSKRSKRESSSMCHKIRKEK